MSMKLPLARAKKRLRMTQGLKPRPRTADSLTHRP